MTVLARRLREVLGPLVDTASRYALIDYPLYNNPGDAAIWLGSRLLLEELHGRPPDYASTLRGFDARDCRRRIEGGCLYLLGGGNWGGLYRRHHDMRLRAVAAMKGNRIVQLPFSVAGLGEALLDETRATLRDHGDVMLIAREKRSAAACGEHLGIAPLLAPDAAHLLSLSAPRPDAPVTSLMRRDREAISTADRSASWDWPDIRRLRHLNRLGKLVFALAPAPARPRVMDWLARAKVTAAVAALARGRIVRTNRLHGMILADLIGREVVAIDNSTGKVAAYLETWNDALPRVRDLDAPLH